MSNITGRDKFVIAKALAYAIESINRLPAERQELSDKADMETLLDSMVESDANLEMVIRRARAHLTGEGW